MSSNTAHSRRLALTLAIAAACLAATAGPAHAADCSAAFDAATHMVAIGNCINAPDAPTIAKISRTVAGSILLDGQPIAGGPTVTNTDAIVYHGDIADSDKVTLDMSNGQFRPGFTPEPVGSSEIGILIDGGGASSTNWLTILGHATQSDSISVSATGIETTGDDDVDITTDYMNGPLTIDGQGGHDHLRGDGFEGHQPSTAPLELRGGAGDDLLTGTEGADKLIGGTGADRVLEEGGGFVLEDTSLIGNGSDTLASIERATLSGSAGPDLIDASAFSGDVALVGYSGNDTLLGGAGDDSINGHAGDDVADGGPGIDRYSEYVLEDAVLTDSALIAPPLGTESLASIEQAYIHGGPNDQSIDASAFGGPVRLIGGAGADALIGGPADDRLEGREGPDELTGGAGTDEILAGAGDDRTFSGDGIFESVDCGEGADAALADQLDGLLDCELLDRGGAPAQPGESGQPGPTGDVPSAPGTPATPGADTIAPALSRLALARTAFAAERGTALRFTLSEQATVRLRIERAARGRRSHGRCVAPSARNRARRRCTRWLRLRGTIAYGGMQGENRLPFRGQLGRRPLRPGRYRLVATATDAAGNRSSTMRARFRIVAR
jgi:hypothetical protein